MSYATQAILTLTVGGADRLRDLSDWDADGVADTGVIAEALSAADAYVDGYLRMRYATPVAVPSDTLIRLSADEAVYWLRTARGMATEQDMERRKDRTSQLEQMRDGKLRPGEPLPEKSTAVVSAFVANPNPMSRNGSRGMW